MKAGLFALAASSLAGSVLARHQLHQAMHVKKAEYYDPGTSSSVKASSSSSVYYYDPPVSSSTKTSSSSSVNYYYEYPSSSSYKSSSTSSKKHSSHSHSYSGHPTFTKSHSKHHTSSFPAAPVKPVSTCKASTTTTTVIVYVDDYTTPAKPVVPSTSTSYTTVSPVKPAPTPVVTTFKTPGVYAIPTVTIHVNNTITVVAKKTSTLTSGTNYYGGWTTTVNGSTTVTAPYVAKETNGYAVTEVISYTVLVCPTAGVYTPVEATKTVVSTKTVIVYAVPTSYAPGVYTNAVATYTATVTDEVYVCPYETVTESTTKVATVTKTYSTNAVASVTWTYPASSSTPAAPIVPSVVYSSSVWAAPSASSSSAKPASSSPAPVVNGKKWAITYTPYTTTGDCKTADEVDADIAIIAGKGFTTVRIYATDCSGLINVGASVKKHGLKIILGVFIKAAGIDDARPQIAQIATWGAAGNWDLVTLIVIGNEAIFNQYVTASSLAGFIGEGKSAFAAAGYYGPVTTTEPLSTLQQSGELCGAIDVVAANIQAFFTSSVTSSTAGTFVASQLELVAAVCPGKTAYNLESGWPSSGYSNGAAQASPADQAAAIADIVDKAGEHSVIFSYDNDAWKSPGTFGVEQYFGCSQLF